MFESVVLFVGGLGPAELFLVFALVVLLFGANKLPELARASGQAMGEFRRGQVEVEREVGASAAGPDAAGMAGEAAVEEPRID